MASRKKRLALGPKAGERGFGRVERKGGARGNNVKNVLFKKKKLKYISICDMKGSRF